MSELQMDFKESTLKASPALSEFQRIDRGEVAIVWTLHWRDSETNYKQLDTLEPSLFCKGFFTIGQPPI